MKLPDWIKAPKGDNKKYKELRDSLEKKKLHTVCIEANCPNRYECFSNNTATFMLLGNNCTRYCKYCNVKHGKPTPLDEEEPERIASMVKELGLKYVVLTMVTRDDLLDGGTAHIAKAVDLLKQFCKVEVLVSDKIDLSKINADVINHNIEVVKRMFNRMRPQGSYRKSIELLKSIKGTSKSGFMVGLGETLGDVKRTLEDLKEANVDIVTIGQYLQPTPEHAPVKKFYTLEEFDIMKEMALGMKVLSGPLVRSSYHAEELA